MTDDQQTEQAEQTTVHEDGRVTISAEHAQALSEELATLRSQAKEHEAAQLITEDEQRKQWGSALLTGLTGQPPTA